MKKLYIIGLMLSLCTAAFAQKSGRDVLDDLEKLEIPKKNVVAVSDNNIFEFKVFSHIGYGFNIARSNDFAPRKGRSGSLFVNLVNINIFPIQWVGLEAGIDIAYNFFTTQENLFMIDNDRNVKVMKFSDLTSLTLPGEAIDRNRSKLSYGSMNVPVLLKGRWKHLEMGLGAELVWNWKGGTSYSYRQANTSTGISTPAEAGSPRPRSPEICATRRRP